MHDRELSTYERRRLAGFKPWVARLPKAVVVGLSVLAIPVIVLAYMMMGCWNGIVASWELFTKEIKYL